MTKKERMESLEFFDMIGHSIEGAVKTKMFGTICYKIGRKPFILFEEGDIVCKLFDEVKERALEIPEVGFFNPMGGDKPMSNWIQLPYSAKDYWEEYAIYALDFVKQGR